MNKDKEVKERIINRLFNVLQEQARIIREDTSLSDEEKLIQLDIVLDLHHFLREHDEAVQVLNKYSRERRGLIENDER